MTQRQELSKCRWTNRADRLAQQRVAMNQVLQIKEFVKNKHDI